MMPITYSKPFRMTAPMEVRPCIKRNEDSKALKEVWQLKDDVYKAVANAL